MSYTPSAPLVHRQIVLRSTHTQDILATGALLLPGHVFGTASQHTCATKTLLTTVSDVNLRRCIGFNVASGAPCDILLNCAIEIFVLNWTELICTVSSKIKKANQKRRISTVKHRNILFQKKAIIKIVAFCSIAHRRVVLPLLTDNISINQSVNQKNQNQIIYIAPYVVSESVVAGQAMLLATCLLYTSTVYLYRPWSAQWRRNRGFRRLSSEPRPPSFWGPDFP